MSEQVLVVWDDELTTYDFGAGHPLRPVRLELTMALARGFGVLSRPNVTVATAEPATDDLLELVHDPAYISAVRRAPDEPAGWPVGSYGLGSSDNPIFARMHEASALVAGGSVGAARAIWAGTAQHAVNLAGGLHHAMRDRASGFCVYDDPAIAIAWLLAQGMRKIAYVDIDVHHGDGVQAAFYGDPRVLTISLHESGYTLFPGTGWPDETGSGEGVGTAVNVALPTGTGDAGWQYAFRSVVPPLVRAFGPDVLVTQLGCDSHALDPLANLANTVDGMRRTYGALHALAHEVCDGRWLAVGGGGYEVVRVVPRAWTAALAEAIEAALPANTPASWRELARDRVPGAVPPTAMSDLPDGWDPAGETTGGADAAAPEAARKRPGPQWGAAVERAVAATRAAVFPAHGLEPLEPAS